MLLQITKRGSLGLFCFKGKGNKKVFDWNKYSLKYIKNYFLSQENKIKILHPLDCQNK